MNLKLARKFATLVVLLACLFVSTSARAEYTQEECAAAVRRGQACEAMCYAMYCGGDAYCCYYLNYECYSCAVNCWDEWYRYYEEDCIQ